MSANPVPYDWGQAREVINAAKAAQKAAEEGVRAAFRDHGAAERAYRMALAQKILKLRADGVPVTICQDLARGDKDVADLRYRRDVAEGVKEAAVGAQWRHHEACRTWRRCCAEPDPSAKFPAHRPLHKLTADRRELEQPAWSGRAAA